MPRVTLSLLLNIFSLSLGYLTVLVLILTRSSILLKSLLPLHSCSNVLSILLTESAYLEFSLNFILFLIIILIIITCNHLSLRYDVLLLDFFMLTNVNREVQILIRFLLQAVAEVIIRVLILVSEIELRV